MHRKRKNTLPYPTSLTLPEILKLKYDNQIKMLIDRIDYLECKINKLEKRFELSSNITPIMQDRLPSFSPPNNTPVEIKEFNLYMDRQNANSFDNLE